MKNHFTNLHRGLALTVLLAAGSLTARAQNVGIGTTAPNASAALDIVSTTKGALLPRVASTGSVASPATGLIVFQTGSPAGFYYNAGTSTVPSWQRLNTPGDTWNLGGNTIGATAKALGTLDNQDLPLVANGVEQGRLTNQGRLLLGLSGPTTYLRNNPGFFDDGIFTRLLLASDAGEGDLTIITGGTGSSPWMNLVKARGTVAAPLAVVAGDELGYINFYGHNGTGYNNSIFLGTLVEGITGGTVRSSFRINTVDGEALRVLANRNVGIGTTAPTATLDVSGSTRLRGLTTAGLVTTDASGNLSSSGTLTGDVTSTGTATTYAAVVPATKGGAGSVSGLLKANGSGTVSQATAGTDYLTPTGSAATLTSFPTLNQNTTGTAATATLASTVVTNANLTGDITSSGNATTYATNVPNAKGGAGTLTGLLKATSGTVAAAVAGTDYAAATGSEAYVQNQTAAAQTGGFNLSGTGTVGGLLTAGSATVAGNIQSSSNIAVDAGNANTGTVANTLRFGPTNSGEAIGSKRTTGGNQFGLDFYTTSTARMSITTGGNVGIGITAPLAGLHVDTPESGSSSALGVITSGGTSGNPSIELRGSAKVPYIDFAENTGVNFSTRLSSQSGTLNAQTSVANVPALNVNGYTKQSGANASVAPAIATAKISATMPSGGSSQTTTVALPTGIVGTKVLSLTAMVYDGNSPPSAYPPNNSIPNLNVAYQVYLFNNQIIIKTNGNGDSSGLFGKAINVLITYEQ